MKSCFALMSALILSAAAVHAEPEVTTVFTKGYSAELFTTHDCGPVVRDGKKVKHVKFFNYFDKVEVRSLEYGNAVALVTEDKIGKLYVASIFVKNIKKAHELARELAASNVKSVAIGTTCGGDGPLQTSNLSEVLIEKF